MKLINPISAGEIHTVADGSLIAIPNENGLADYAVILKKFDEMAHLAVLRCGDADKRPHFATAHLENDCLSFGSNWAFEIVPPKPGENALFESDDSPGSILISQDQAFLRLGRDPRSIQSGAGYLDLSTLTPAGARPRNAAVLRKWKVWLSAEHIIQPGRTALISSDG